MKKLRCDQKADCDDQSDEASCQIVHLNPEQYLKDKPPPPLEVGSLVKILVNVDIERILTISEVFRDFSDRQCFQLLQSSAPVKVDGIFETQQNIGLEWRDPRLKVRNFVLILKRTNSQLKSPC